MVTFGPQVHSKGILGGSEEARRHIGYLTKYLTKSTGEVVAAGTNRQRQHHERLHDELRLTPCSPRCAVWLLYGSNRWAPTPGRIRGTARAGSPAHHARPARSAGAGVAEVVRQDARRPPRGPESVRPGMPGSGGHLQARARPVTAGLAQGPARRPAPATTGSPAHARDRGADQVESRVRPGATRGESARSFGNWDGGLRWGRKRWVKNGI